MYIETPEKTITKGDKEVFEFLSDLKNFEILMPDNIDKFEVLSEDRFLFALKGMPEIVLERKSQTEFSQLVLGAASEKLPFTLTADISDKGGSEADVKLSFQGSIKIALKYDKMTKDPVIKKLQRVSKPGLRKYTGADNLPRVLNGLGVAIVSTSHGVMTSKQAKNENVGGEVLCYVY